MDIVNDSTADAIWITRRTRHICSRPSTRWMGLRLPRYSRAYTTFCAAVASSQSVISVAAVASASASHSTHICAYANTTHHPHAPGRPCSARCSSSGALEAVRPARVGLQHVCDLVVSRSCAIVSMRGQELLTVGTHRRLFVARRARRATRFRLFVWVVDQLAEEEEHRPSLRRMSNACGSAAVRLFERSSRWRTLPPLDHRKAGASTGASTRGGSECSM